MKCSGLSYHRCVHSIVNLSVALLFAFAGPRSVRAAAGDVIEGAISVAGERDVYSFTLESEERIYFDALSNVSRLNWSLNGAAGTYVANRSFVSSDAQSIADPTILLGPGSYTITIQDSDGATDPYSFCVLKFSGAALISPGTTITGELAPANSTRLYQLTAAAGDRFVFDQISRTGIPNSYWKLYDPYGNQVFNQGFGSDAGTVANPISLAASGRYVLAIEGYIGDPGATGSYSFNVNPQGNVPPAAFTGDPLTLGQTISANHTAGATESYIFTLPASKLVSFDSLVNVSGVNWSLDGPSGLIVNQRGLTSTDGPSNVGPWRLPAGNYRLRITGNGNAAYQFRLIDLSTATTLTLNASTTATVNPGTATVPFQFQANRDDKLFFDSTSVTGLPNCYWRLIDPNGSVIFNASIYSDQGRITLALTGTYLLLVDGYIFDSTSGSFTFKVNSTTDALDALTLGTLVSDTLDTPGEQHQYSFSLTSTTRLYFDSLVNTGQLRWTLNGPGGTVINNRGFNQTDAQSNGQPLFSLSPGPYTLTVFGSGENTGAYSFRLVDTASAPDLTLGSLVSESLAPANATHLYKFTVPADGRYYFDSQGVTGLPNAILRLYDSHSVAYLNQGLSSDTGPFTLLAGSYLLLVEGYVGDTGSGTYSLNLLPATTGEQTLAFNTTQFATISQPGGLQKFTFTVPTAGEFYFDSWTNRSNFRWTLANNIGTVVNLRSFSGSDAQSFSDPILRLGPGDYTLTVSANADEVGTVMFRFLNLSAATTLTPGTEISAALNPANSTHAYAFNVATAGEYFYDRISSSAMPNGWLRLFDSHGRQLISGGFDSDAGPLNLLPGRHLLLVEGYIGEVGAANYTFNFRTIADGSQPLTLGNVTSGSIASPGQQQRYTFTLASPRRLYFDARSNPPSLRWSLAGALGTYADRAFSNSDAQSGSPFLDLPAGDFTLTVQGSGDATGAYDFRLFDVTTAAPLTPGTAVTSNLTPGNSTLAYQFNVATTGVYYFDAQTVTLPNTWLRLVGSVGNQIISGAASSDFGPFTMVPGMYYLYVEGYIGDTANGSVTFNLLPVVDGSQALTLGSLTSGNISNPGQSQRYTFSLVSSARLYFDSRTNNPQLRWSLDGPLGTVIVNRSFTSSDAQSISSPVFDLAAGNYTLTVAANGDAVGSYQFRLFDLATANPLALGVTTGNNSFVANSTDAYKFTASAGDRVQFVRVSAVAIPNAYWRLVNPLGGFAFAQGLGSDPGTFTLPVGGVYTLLIEGYIGDPGTGSYSINASGAGNTPPTPFTGAPLVIGNTVSGNLTTAATVDAYTFSLASPTRLYFDALTSAGFIWTLEGRTGLWVNNRSFQSSDAHDIGDPRVYLPAGDYQLRVTGLAGAYQFRLLDFASATPMTAGTPVVTTLSPSFSTALYKFDAVAGNQFYMDGRGAVPTGGGNHYNPYIRIFGPLGDLIGAQTSESDIDTFAVGQTGTYVVAVEGRIYDQNTQDVNTFVLLPIVHSTNALTLGNTVNANIPTPGIRRYYTFTLASPATLYFDALTRGDFSWRLDGSAGQVVNWRSFLSTDAQDIGDPALRLPAGSYTITVAGNNFNSIGDYSFRMVDFASGSAMTTGSPVNTTLLPANTTVIYRFNGVAGDLYYFDGLSYTDAAGAGSSYAAYVRLYTPSGSLIMSQNVNSQLDTFRLPESGQYTVLVEGRIYNERPSQDNSFRLIPITYPSNSISLGATVNGTLATPGIRNNYTFTLNSPATLYFDAFSNDTFAWRLDAPWGQIFDWRSFQSADGGDIGDPFLRLQAGSYTLSVVGSSFRTTGSYSFRLLDVATASPMTVGTPVATTLTPANSTVFYKFNATAGALYYFDGLGFTNDPPGGPNYPAHVRVLSPAGQIIASQSVSGDLDTFSVPESGTYFVSVEGRIYDAHTSQANGFNLIPVTYPTTPLIFGTTINGNLPTFGVRNRYTFTLTEPRMLVFDALSNVSMGWRIDSPWGTIVDWRSFQSSDGPDITEPLLALDAGAYTLTVAGNGFAVAGDYSFRLLDFSAASPMTPGGQITATLSPNRSTKLYRFNGTVGASYYFDGQPSSGFTQQPYVRLYSPYGRRLFSQNANADVDTFRIPETGTYVLAVDGRIYDDGTGGTYNFNLQPIAPPVAVPLFDAASAPDLIVNNISVTPASGIESGSSITIHWTDQNTGLGNVIDSFSDRVTVRNVAQAVLADTIVAYNVDAQGNGAITAGTGRLRQATLILPDGPPATGALQVTIVSDTLNSVAESTEANNASNASFNATLAPYPDLVVENVAAVPSQRWMPGSTVTVNWRVRNIGNGVADTDWAETVIVRNSSSAVIASRGTNYNISAAGNGNIGVGEFRNRSLTFDVPNDLNAYGLFTITVTTDSGQALFEYNAAALAEQNNSSSAQILSAPDLLPTGVSVTSTGPLVSGATLTVQWTNRNNGTADAAVGFYDRVTIARTSGEALLNNVYYFDPNNPVHGIIAPGETRVRSITFPLPDGPAGVGNFQVTVSVDTFNSVPEVNLANTAEANNTIASSIFSPTIAPYPDLRASNLSISPAILGAGTNVVITWQDTNGGNGPAARPWYDRVVIVNTNSGVTMLNTVVYHNTDALGPINGGAARDRSFTYTLPNDTDATGNLLFTVTADAFDNIFEHNVALTAEDNNAAQIVRPLTATPLPDLVIASITAPASALANQNVNAQFRIENRGTAAASASSIQRVFISTSPSPGSGVLVTQKDSGVNLGIGAGVDQPFTFTAPSAPGTYWLIAQADSGSAITESRESNNYLVSSATFTVQPTYTATVSAGIETALAGTPVPLTGRATLTGTADPSPFSPVLIHIQVRGTDRTLQVLSGADGTFNAVFQPLTTEAGNYQVSAAHPGVPAPAPQDTFTLIGMGITPIGVMNIVEGETTTNITTVANLSDVPLTALTAQVLPTQPNLVATATLDTNVLGAFSVASLRVTIQALNATILQSPVVVRLTTAEGATADLNITARVEPLRPRLIATPSQLGGVMQRGAQTPKAVTIANQGGVPTGSLQIVLPNVPWLSLASPSQLPPLAPGESTVITLLLNPAATLPLGDYNGTIVVESSNAAMQVPFAFRAVSTARGDLRVTAEDEYTYFAAGSPRLAGANVSVRDALSGQVVASATTDSNGNALLEDLIEAHYLVDVTAADHNSFRQSALVVGGTETNVVAFLSRQSVRYSFTVTPTTVEDRYTFNVDTTFETQVPIPVVTISPASLDLAAYPETEFQVQFTIANHGLIEARNAVFNIPSTDRLQFTLLVNDIGTIPANSSIIVPVLVRRLPPPAAPLLTKKGKDGSVAQDYLTGQCSVTGEMLWNYLCGPNVVDKSTATYVFDSTGCDLVELYRQVYHLVPDAPPSAGPGIPIITNDEYFDYLNQLQPIDSFEAPPGYHFECNRAPGVPLVIRTGKKGSTLAQSTPPPTNVCAKVEIRLSQRAVLARDAFNATLTVDNQVPSAMQNVQVNLTITDLNGVPATPKFGLTLGQLSGINDVNGAGSIAAQSTATANWTLVPTLDAAPTNGVTIYLVSGTLSYTQDGVAVNVPLAAAPIQVYPQPELFVRYFHSRDVFADDPFTPEVEPSIPYSLAALVQNIGYGAARSLSITGSKPEIRENEKGLQIDFQIIGAQLENQAINPALDITFGRIEPGTNRIARWLFTSTVQGNFTNFSASFSQVDQFGNPRTSLVRGVAVHELNHIVDANGPGADNRPDFLVNDTSDVDFLPDTIYFSNGSNAPVSAVTSGTVSGAVSTGNLTVTLAAPATTGWTYLRFLDPGQGQFRLTRVVRSDGTEVPLEQNAWTTARHFRGGNLEPIRTNMVHIFDYNTGPTYTLTYQPIQATVVDTTAPTSAVTALPASSARNFTVQWSGSDNVGGSGIANYDVYVSTNGGPFGRWITSTPSLAATFNGDANTSYAFYSRALDSAGNREAAPATGDASTTTTSSANVAPSITAISTQTVNEGDLFTYQPTANNDTPSETLTWSLAGASPAGALVNPATGRISWQTSVGQGGTMAVFTIVVTDSGSPSLSSSQTFNVNIVQENFAPIISAVAQPVIVEQGTTLSLQLTATDPNPGDTLTWSIQSGAPQGLTITPAGLISWTPTAAQNGTLSVVNVRVTDNGSPVMFANASIAIRVHAPNRAPSLLAIANRSASVLLSLLQNTTGSDPDAPGQLLTYSLDAGAPQGVRINPVTGVLTWTPHRGQANTVNTITVRVTDNGDPAMSATRTFTITVDDFIEVLLGNANVFSGQSGDLPIGLDLSSAVTNLDFTITIPQGKLSNVALAPAASPLGAATIQETSPGTYRVNLRAAAGQSLAATDALSELQFDTLVTAPSGFVPLTVSSVVANRADGLAITRTLAQNGRVVMVQQAPVLELLKNGAQVQLTIYAQPGAYVIESTPSLVAPVQWTQEWQGNVADVFTTISLPIGANNAFYRARTP
ncbi:MAG TPA: CARDB domain-containing protein [Verrucomicrobiae bacterium]|nr:CARDB domain-containing protein [Verrucomicrobiae bacterium]